MKYIKRPNLKMRRDSRYSQYPLDSKVDSWKAAIAKDGLKWPYHVSDLKKWQNEAAAVWSAFWPYELLD